MPYTMGRTSLGAAPVRAQAQPGNTNYTIAMPPGTYGTQGGAAPAGVRQTQPVNSAPFAELAGPRGIGGPHTAVTPTGGGGISQGVLSDMFNNAGASTPGPTFNNTAQNNPDLEYAINGLKGQLSNDTTGHAIDMAGGKLRDLAEGQKSAAAAGRTARGVSGTSVDSYDSRNIDAGTQRALAGQATDITMAREAQKNSIYGQIAGAGASQAGINQADRGLALQQWETDQSNQRAREQAQAAQQASIMNMLLNAA